MVCPNNKYIVEINTKKSQIYKYDNVLGVTHLDNMIVLISKREDNWIKSIYDPDQILSFTYKEKVK
jgi:hypothetical protein|tara:strand:+ start:304 stop:501 length:198 start_codon:yes stop_codon:yes gene_type:complete